MKSVSGLWSVWGWHWSRSHCSCLCLHCYLCVSHLSTSPMMETSCSADSSLSTREETRARRVELSKMRMVSSHWRLSSLLWTRSTMMTQFCQVSTMMKTLKLKYIWRYQTGSDCPGHVWQSSLHCWTISRPAAGLHVQEGEEHPQGRGVQQWHGEEHPGHHRSSDQWSVSWDCETWENISRSSGRVSQSSSVEQSFSRSATYQQQWFLATRNSILTSSELSQVIHSKQRWDRSTY